MCMYIDACTHPYVHSYFARAILCNDIPYIWIAMGSLERFVLQFERIGEPAKGYPFSDASKCRRFDAALEW